MQQYKHVVICGPDLDLTNFSVGVLIKEYRLNLSKSNNINFLEIPESNYGNGQVKDLIIGQISRAPNSNTLIVTRQGVSINTFGELIERGFINNNEFLCILVEKYQESDSGIITSHHKMTSSGIMESGWPIGILW